jgi:hypothetical protein
MHLMPVSFTGAAIVNYQKFFQATFQYQHFFGTTTAMEEMLGCNLTSVLVQNNFKKSRCERSNYC